MKQLGSELKRRCYLKRQGIVPYAVAWEEQRSLLEDRLNNPERDDILIILQHPPVYTLGTGATEENLKFDPQASSIPLYRTERGGEVTYHCLGQLVGYPILNLRYYRCDLHWYLRQLETVLIRTLGEYGLSAEREAGLTGVWVKGVKVGAIGIKAKRWFTMHGFSLNVCPDLSGFSQIIPCGIRDRAVGSLQQFCPDITLSEVQQTLIRNFAEVFEVELYSDQ
ncbi:lipoate-protein ligase B [Halothece sp. PCC 7418]|uniref:lipoyl(octanoyl) transferase LipB n=1 Tax=Halothece sp. (strain PCC 7418) TaxID=65093 RepID=UPI0002A05E96|nr:lipoyl(octanoyl) transferase LipB [Halothece sp. PCC 7418]AFZ45083.1 lipoate-protein ligase B [Halothece sp. PCC 7418]